MEPISDEREKRSHSDFLIFGYTIFVAIFSILFFLHGFFPIVNYRNSIASMNDIPQFVGQIRVKKEELYQPVVKKVVLMVIDAFRWNFIMEYSRKDSMPNLNNLLENNVSCLLQAKVDPPTVTMPKIKALISGTVPSFIEIVQNLGGNTVIQDSVLQQAKNHGHNIIFYGDDTWIKLFPNIFTRHDGTSSFFVTDFAEVDNNVTRHIKEELDNNDWSMMILHYLGLDHIGHVAGPFSPLVKPKLQEMDKVIGQIQFQINQWNNNNIPSLLIVCGDHGMKDSGGHGGATLEEILVPVITIGLSCSPKSEEPSKIGQIDLASTLSIILGIPIPASNLGSASLDILNCLPVPRKLFLLYYNSKQLLKNFKTLENYEAHQAFKNYESAVKLHIAWLQTDGQSDEMVGDIIELYRDALKRMKETLTGNIIQYDIPIMTISTIFLLLVSYIMISERNQVISVPKTVALSIIIASMLLWLSLNFVFGAKGETVLFPRRTSDALLTTVLLFILVLNSYLCTKFQFSSSIFSQVKHENLVQWTQESQNVELKPFKLPDFWTFLISLNFPFGAIRLSLLPAELFLMEPKVWLHQTENLLNTSGMVQAFLPLGGLLHTVSLSSTSFIEEEHQTWYFLWLTYLVYAFYDTVWRCSTQQSCEYSRVDIGIKLFLVMLGHRIFRHLNSTGNKYAHLPDISDWLLDPDNKIALTLFFISGILLLIQIDYVCEEERFKKSYCLFNIFLAACIYLRHMVTGTLIGSSFYPHSKGIIEVRIFWILVLIYISHCALRLSKTAKNSRSQFLFFSVRLWTITSALLHRPHNCILLPSQLLFSSVIQMVTRSRNIEGLEILPHIWLGNIFYFYQGNSNSFATIDVASGYVGLETYIPSITALFIVINTYSAPVLAYLTFLYHETCGGRLTSNHILLRISKQYAVWRLLPISIYTIIVTVERYHLFVWTVFAPKLVYEAVHCAVMYFIIIFMLLIFIVYDYRDICTLLTGYSRRYENKMMSIVSRMTRKLFLCT